MAGQDRPDARRQDFEVERKAPVIDVPDVERELLLPADRVAAVDLRPAGDARPDLEAPGLLGAVEPVLAVNEGPRADVAHLALEHVPQRRKLVERLGLANNLLFGGVGVVEYLLGEVAHTNEWEQRGRDWIERVHEYGADRPAAG